MVKEIYRSPPTRFNNMKKEVIQKRIDYLKAFLASKPSPNFYDGESEVGGDWVEQENRQNDLIEENVKKEIRKLEKMLV